MIPKEPCFDYISRHPFWSDISDCLIPNENESYPDKILFVIRYDGSIEQLTGHLKAVDVWHLIDDDTIGAFAYGWYKNGILLDVACIRDVGAPLSMGIDSKVTNSQIPWEEGIQMLLLEVCRAYRLKLEMERDPTVRMRELLRAFPRWHVPKIKDPSFDPSSSNRAHWLTWNDLTQRWKEIEAHAKLVPVETLRDMWSNLEGKRTPCPW